VSPVHNPDEPEITNQKKQVHQCGSADETIFYQKMSKNGTGKRKRVFEQDSTDVRQDKLARFSGLESHTGKA